MTGFLKSLSTAETANALSTRYYQPYAGNGFQQPPVIWHMKHFLLLLFCLATLSGFGQFNKAVTIRATAHINIVLNGLGTNEAGAGLGLDAALFSKHRLQAIIETSADGFIGDKLLFIDSITGEQAKAAAVYSVKAGPHFFITPHWAIAVTYGPAWHIVRDFMYTVNGGWKYSISGFFGRQRQLVTKLFLVTIPVQEQGIQYMGIAAGVRF